MALSTAEILSFWGKAQPRDGGAAVRWHPVAYHLLDVAAVADALLEARPLALTRVASLLALSTAEARCLLVALAGLHDLGKFAPAFQAKAPAHWPAGVLGTFGSVYGVPRAHTEDGIVLWDEHLADAVGERLWRGGEEALHSLAPAVFGHHGRPVSAMSGGDPARLRFGKGIAVAERCAHVVADLLLPTAVGAQAPGEERVRLASWLVSGLLTVADWVGSNERWFPYVAPACDDHTLQRYWDYARPRAARAVREAGLVPSPARAHRSFPEIAGRSDTPTPVQRWASEVELPGGQLLLVIEDVTGSGKTEAAQMLVHRLMAAGRATGAYRAMPTMATANAMYARQEKAIGALYELAQDGAKPSLVLAHGQQRLHEHFRSTVLRPDDPLAPVSDSVGDGVEPDSSVACAAFLADDSRTSLLADVGAGTIDQALLGVLPRRFATMRLLGLAEKVIVVDEAHAYDAYVTTELKELLRFQVALGGSAVVLSATLTRKQRAGLVSAWADGLAGGGRAITYEGGASARSSEYPLATIVAGAGVTETAVAAADWSRRSVGVRLVHDEETALAHVMNAHARHGAVAWVRNTVDDCLTAAAMLRARGVEPLVFHARFAQGDRQEREQEVMARFGPAARTEDRAARVLVATQVVEQSLDLDFDAMVSDLAPVDLLIQRAGRLWRHRARTEAGRPTGLSRELVVLAPEPVSEPPANWLGGRFAGTARVYENANVLWRTARTLAERGCIQSPDGLRALIEDVYDVEALVPDSLLAVAQRAQGKQSAHASVANQAVLKAPDGYEIGREPWTTDMRPPTRLGDARTTVRMARARGDGSLEPWCPAETSWQAWALSEVSVRAYRVPLASTPDARWAGAVARLRAGWGRYEQEIPVVVLEPAADERWSGHAVTPEAKLMHMSYTFREGLDFRADSR